MRDSEILQKNKIAFLMRVSLISELIIKNLKIWASGASEPALDDSHPYIFRLLGAAGFAIHAQQAVTHRAKFFSICIHDHITYA